MKPFADWLLRARLSQTMPDGRPWTQDYLLSRMAERGWAPHRPNYSRYENGKAEPQPETIARFVDFWASYGVEPPDLNPPPPEVPKDPTLLLVEELRAWRLEDRQRIQMLEATVERLSQALLGRGGTGAPTTTSVPRG